jgi:hypothetical protein
MTDEPGWSRFIDCRFRRSKRVLRLKALSMTPAFSDLFRDPSRGSSHRLTNAEMRAITPPSGQMLGRNPQSPSAQEGYRCRGEDAAINVTGLDDRATKRSLEGHAISRSSGGIGRLCTCLGKGPHNGHSDYIGSCGNVGTVRCISVHSLKYAGGIVAFVINVCHKSFP